MSKKTATYLLIGGALVSLYDAMSGGSLYGAGKPLEKLRWKIYTTASGTNYYLSISDAAALTGAAILLFKRG